MTALVKGDVVFPLSNHSWMNFRSYEWWSPATTGSSIRTREIGPTMNFGQSSLGNEVGAVVVILETFVVGQRSRGSVAYLI